MGSMIKCKICNTDIATSAKVCPACGAKNKKPFYTKVWFWWLVSFVVICIAAGANSSDSSAGQGSSNEHQSATNTVISNANTAFAGDCGISASAEMGESIIGYPELKISIKNTSDKDISAIKFYFIPVDVYGEEIKSWTRQSNLYTDTTIGVGKTDSIAYQLIEDSVKSGKLYVYSVFFSDGTEWGDKDATTSTILKNGLQIEVS